MPVVISNTLVVCGQYEMDRLGGQIVIFSGCPCICITILHQGALDIV